MTFGAGWHTSQIINADKNVIVYALDRDPVAYNYAIEKASVSDGQLIPLLGKFSN